MLINRLLASKQTVVALSKAMWNSKSKAQGAAVDQLGFVLEFDPSESRMVVMIFLRGRPCRLRQQLSVPKKEK